MLAFALSLAFVWGVLWALFIHFTALGLFLRKRRTWITVVVGVGGDLLIMLIVIPIEWWWQVVAIIVLSALSIIYECLHNELAEQLREMEIVVQNPAGQQDDLGA